jgi:phage terminase large subunit-like protein
MIKIDKIKYPNVAEGFEYAQQVVAGEIPNSKYVVGACKRFLDEYNQTFLKDSTYIFDTDYVERYLRLVQNFSHVIGTWDTVNIIYNPWQKWLWSASLGFKFSHNKAQPKYRTLHIEVPRGCAKSTMASQCALYFIGLDPSRVGEKIACFATKSEQSRIILDAARAMAMKAPKYLKATGIDVQMHKILDPNTFSEMVAMSSDSKSMDGLNLRIAFCDELHAMTRELFEVIVSGQKKRRDSLTICLTTAGFNTDGIGYSQSQYAKKVCLGEIKDEAFFAVVYTIDDGDDIFDEVSWRKANPNYGHSVDPIAFTSTAEKVKFSPSDKPNFLVKSLNVWLSEANAYFDMEKWDACADPTLKIEDFYNKACYTGLDLASKVDLTAKVKVFREKGIYYIFQEAYLPEETVNKEHSALYDNTRGTELTVTPGEAINYEFIEKEVLADQKKFKVEAVHYDPWNSVELSQKLSKERVNMVEFRMNVANLSEPMKNLDALIRQGKVRHNGGELLRFCMSNVVAKEDHNQNVYPRKSSSKLKIDLAIALLMAYAGWMVQKETTSIYETRGILSV